MEDIQWNCIKSIFRYFKCNKNYNKDFNKELINRFSSSYKFCNGDINKFTLLLRKGVYPYEYMDSQEGFDETSLPNKKDFYSSLNMEDITDIDYRHAEKGFKDFNMASLLKKYEVELELFTDPNILLMIEEGVRGGTTQVSHRYAEANNKYMKSYDKNKESSYLMYLDANNLYGWSMSQKQPVGIYKWVKKLMAAILDLLLKNRY